MQCRAGLYPKGLHSKIFFKEFQDRRRDGRPGARRSSALGSGFVVSADGFIVTNNHVIDGADEIEIEFFTGEILPATVIGTDKNTDIAVLKVEPDVAAALREALVIATPQGWGTGLLQLATL